MNYPHLPLADPRPDAATFVDVLMGRNSQPRVPLIEYIIDDVVMRPILTDLLGRPWSAYGSDWESQRAYLDNFVQFWYRMGYDVVRFEWSLPFREIHSTVQDAAPGSWKQRDWPDEHHGAISSWEEFEQYRWPNVEEFDFRPFEYLNAHLPDGMGFVTCHGGGVYEHLSWIMSFEGLCTALYEAPDLVRAVADRLGGLMEQFYRNLLTLDRVCAIFPGDDMGYKKSTLVAPETLRTYVLPWHRRFAAMSHDRGVPYFLHSCGNILAIMPDLLDDVGIDGKHSYEDVIIPAEEFQTRYGDRVAVLGGVDLNILSGKPPDDVRRRVRELIRVCGARGRYALGSGNSVPSYVPVENYLSMIDEAHATLIG